MGTQLITATVISLIVLAIAIASFVIEFIITL